MLLYKIILWKRNHSEKDEMLPSALIWLWKFIRLWTVSVLLGNLLQQNNSWTQASHKASDLASHKDDNKIN